jgi:gamma-glutamyltranspeptidase/glutathione hydrolase
MKKRFTEKRASIAQSPYGMVSTASGIATDAGVKILEKGGNAVDAAVAAAFCLGVAEPHASGIGGQSMVLLHLADSGRTIALDGSSRAPFAVSPMHVPKKPLTIGLQASTVPSTPAVLGYLLEHYGELTLQEVLEPSIVAAQDGFKITSLQHRLIKREMEELRKDPMAAHIFLKDSRPLYAGEILRQEELASCLKRMADAGWEDFYHGEIGRKIIGDMQSRNGQITEADLSQIPVPIERLFLETSYRRYILRMYPPPGAGRALVQILNILEKFHPDELRPGSPAAAIIMTLATHSALQSLERWPIDPAIYNQLRKRPMLHKGYAQEIARRIRMVLPPEDIKRFVPPETSGETTHLSVADHQGNAVGITQSIELVFGCKRMARGLGFFYNNYMSCFNYKDMTHPYFLLPGAFPWSSVAPALVFKGRRPLFLLGSPGSERIAPTLAQVITGLIDANLSLDDAISHPRLHCSRKGKVHIEADRFHPDVLDALVQAGFQVKKRAAYSFYLGCVQAVQLPEKKNKPFIGVADPRRGGKAGAPGFKS